MVTQGTAMISESLQLYKALSQRPLKVGESVEVPMTMALPMPPARRRRRHAGRRALHAGAC